MGCPGIYYNMCLQNFAHALAYKDDKKLARELLEEELNKRLENFILNMKKEIDEKQFYFEAGRAVQYMIEDVNKNDKENEL